MIKSKKSIIVLGALTCTSQLIMAQQMVDPSVVNPSSQNRFTPPKESPNFSIGPKAGKEDRKSSGENFQLKGIKFSGNSVFSTLQLNEVIKVKIGQPVDFSGLQDLVDLVSDYYLAAGYPFSRVYIPTQDVANGVVEFTIMEGYFGGVLATVGVDSQAKPNADAQAFLGQLKRGEVITSPGVERVGLIMNDLPGYVAVPIIRPSTELGAGDLEMRLTETPQLRGKIGIDNHGSASTGKNRVKGDVERSRNFIFGDSIKLSGLVTDGKTNFVAAAYGFPIMARGARLELSAIQSSYELGGILKASDFKGESTIMGAQASYPLVRTRMSNMTILGSYQNRRFSNDRGLTEKYVIDAFPLGLTFDWRDGINGGAVTYGDIFYTVGSVTKDNSPNSNRDQNYSKINFNIARIQQLTKNIQASARYAVQYSQNNLDSTEFISLAGPTGVRSYPVGEFSGHVGWVGQIELAYLVPETNHSPYVFYDKGNSENRTTTIIRNISGKGIGLRLSQGDLTFDVSASWSVTGGTSLAERDSKSPRLWASLGLRF